MGLLNLSRICVAVLSFTPLVALSAGPVSVEVAAGTTTYKIVENTVRTPPNVTLSSARDITPYVERIPNNGLSQSAQGRLFVAQKASSVPVNGFFNVSGETVKSGAKAFLRTASRASVYGLGLQALLDAANWTFGDHGELLRPSGGGDPTNPSYWGSAPEGVTYSARGEEFLDIYSAAQAVVSAGIGCTKGECTLVGVSNFSPNCLETLSNNCSVKPIALKDDRPHSQGYFGSILVSNKTGGITCKTGSYDVTHFGCYSSETEFVPVTESDIDSLVDSSYQSEPSDWDSLFPYIEPTSFTLDTPLTSLELSPEVSTSTNSETGKVTTTEKISSVDFIVSDNSTSSPSISSTETSTDNVYIDGKLVSSNTTTTTSKPPASGSSSLPPSSGSGFQLPDFCSWATPVCRFYDWVMEPFNDPEPDLSSIIHDDDFSKTYDFMNHSKTCPEPIDIHITFLNRDIQLTYDFACDLAEYAYFFIMLSAYFSAIYISAGVVRNA